jgi:predicted nucleotidyltransferase
VLNALRRVIESEPRVAYAVLFGSAARGSTQPHSDIDIAVGLSDPAAFDMLATGDLAVRLEAAAGRPVDLVLLNDAPPALAYRVFRDGQPLCVRDVPAYRARLARAVLDYLDFQPVEALFTRGVLRARHGR